MKRIFNLILSALCVIAYTSCSDDEGMEYTHESSIKIISRDVNFPASASQGSVVVEAPGAITVETSDKGWCTTTVSGQTIQVNVEENPSLESRSSELTIRCGNDVASIVVLQSGLIFETSAGSHITVGDNAGTYQYDINCNTELTITPSDNWITVNVEDGKMNVTLAENNTGHVRRGSIIYAAGTYKDEIVIVQQDFEKDIAGDYMLFFTDAEDGKTYYFDVLLSKDKIDIPDLLLSIPVTFNQSNCTLVVKGGQYMGDYGTYKVHTTIWDTTLGYLSWSNAVSMSAGIYYQVEEGEGYTIAPFMDDGSWAGYHPDAIRFEAFSSTTLSSDTRLNALISMINPALQRSHGPQVANYRMNKMNKKVAKANVKKLLK